MAAWTADEQWATCELHCRLLRGLVALFESATRGATIKSRCMHRALVAIASLVSRAPDRFSLMRDYLAAIPIHTLLKDTLAAARSLKCAAAYHAADEVAVLFGISKDETKTDEAV